MCMHPAHELFRAYYIMLANVLIIEEARDKCHIFLFTMNISQNVN